MTAFRMTFPSCPFRRAEVGYRFSSATRRQSDSASQRWSVLASGPGGAAFATWAGASAAAELGGVGTAAGGSGDEEATGSDAEGFTGVSTGCCSTDSAGGATDCCAITGSVAWIGSGSFAAVTGSGLVLGASTTCCSIGSTVFSGRGVVTGTDSVLTGGGGASRSSTGFGGSGCTICTLSRGATLCLTVSVGSTGREATRGGRCTGGATGSNTSGAESVLTASTRATSHLKGSS